VIHVSIYVSSVFLKFCISIFQKLFVVPAWTGWKSLWQCGYFSDKGMGNN